MLKFLDYEVPGISARTSLALETWKARSWLEVVVWLETWIAGAV
jgi:hypothetical protein